MCFYLSKEEKMDIDKLFHVIIIACGGRLASSCSSPAPQHGLELAH